MKLTLALMPSPPTLGFKMGLPEAYLAFSSLVLPVAGQTEELAHMLPIAPASEVECDRLPAGTAASGPGSR